MTPPPGWVTLFAEWLHPIALTLCAALPFVRASVRRYREIRPCFTRRNAMHDGASGVTFPHFIALILMPLYPGILTQIEHHAFVLAGLMGIIYTVADLAEAGPINRQES
jgi:hypothetical protein